MTSYGGNEGCNCINQTSILASLPNRDCLTSAGQPGIYLTIDGSCVPYTYGSGGCLPHDLLHDPTCQSSDPQFVPPWCYQTWCYVDANSCKKNSEEDVSKSDYFQSSQSNNEKLFYSFSTCNSTDYFWQQKLASSSIDVSVIGEISLSAAIPDYQFPMLGKRLVNGTELTHQHERGEEYFNDSIPFTGLYIDYIQSLVQKSNGDIKNVTFTHTSKANLKRYSESSFTAAVRDVEIGLVDMAVGPFWITGQRLKMTTFTVPLVYDKTVLVIPKPSTRQDLAYEVTKVAEPFTAGLWGVLIAIILVAAVLSVWFSDREMIAKKQYGVHLSQMTNSRKKQSRVVYLRLLLDAVLEKGMFLFSAGIEQDLGASLPHKVLMFGFGFFILIAVSAYVANLAAFLTQSEYNDVRTMTEVVEQNKPICCHPALEEEIRSKWPKANWYFPDDGFYGMFDAYERGDCQVLAIGKEDTIMNRDYLAKICEHNLVYTNDVIHENPIAFPIRPDLASAFSYWMYTSEKSHGVSLASVKENFIEETGFKAQCDFKLSDLKMEEVNAFASVNTSNMFLPIIAFVICAVIAVILQLIHESKRKKGKTSSIGRKSTLDIFEHTKNRYRPKDDSIAVQRKDCPWDQQVDEDEKTILQLNSLLMRSARVDDSIVDSLGRDDKRLQVCDFPGAGIPGDEFIEQDVPRPQSTPDPNSNPTSPISVDRERNNEEISRRMEQIVESGLVEEVLDCFDFFQEIKKLKKDQ